MVGPRAGAGAGARGPSSPDEGPLVGGMSLAERLRYGVFRRTRGVGPLKHLVSRPVPEVVQLSEVRMPST